MITVTPQEGRTLELFSQGLTMKAIALTLGVSYSRVVTILNALLIKTGLKTKRELLANSKTIKFEVKQS